MVNKLEGERIYLEPISEKNINAFVKWTNDPEINRFTTGRGFNAEEEMEWVQEIQKNPHEHVFSIFLKENNKLMGNCGLHGNYQLREEFNGRTFLGILIGEKDEWGKGYGVDVINVLKKYAKEVLKEKELFLSVDFKNERAQKLYKKCGFETVLKWHNPKRVTISKEEIIMKAEL